MPILGQPPRVILSPDGLWELKRSPGRLFTFTQWILVAVVFADMFGKNSSNL